MVTELRTRCDIYMLHKDGEMLTESIQEELTDMLFAVIEKQGWSIQMYEQEIREIK